MPASKGDHVSSAVLSIGVPANLLKISGKDAFFAILKI
jgi:hypothetical protein